jgi:hypothetical protein
MGVKTFLTVVSVIVVLGLMVSGCAKPPQADIDAVKASLDAARQAEAERYVPDDYNKATSSLSAAEQEVEHQKSRFALLRNYKQAVALLGTAKADAEAAKTAADTKKQEVKAEAEKLVVDTQTAIGEVKMLMEKAPKGKEGKAALELIQTDLTTLETSLPEVQTTISGGDYLSARDQARSKLDKANSLKSELEAAIQKKEGAPAPG